MAIGAGTLLEISVGGQLSGQQWLNVWTYRVDGEPGSPTPAHIGEAFWNAAKTTYRPLIASAHGAPFQTVKVRELDVAEGEYGEFAIPTGERAGTGTTGSGGVLTQLTAAGVRLTVATRVTRPGQKRISGQDEGDANGNSWETAYQTKLNAWATAMIAIGVLGSPAVGTTLECVIVRKDRATGLPVAHQPVVGFLVNPFITSQVTRKVGRGS